MNGNRVGEGAKERDSRIGTAFAERRRGKKKTRLRSGREDSGCGRGRG